MQGKSKAWFCWLSKIQIYKSDFFTLGEYSWTSANMSLLKYVFKVLKHGKVLFVYEKYNTCCIKYIFKK